MEIFTFLANVLLGLTVFPLGYFIYRYARYSPWRATLQGKTLMYQKVVFLLFMLFINFQVHTDNVPGEEFYRFLVYLPLLAFFVAMTVILVISQHRDKKERGRLEQNLRDQLKRDEDRAELKRIHDHLKDKSVLNDEAPETYFYD